MGSKASVVSIDTTTAGPFIERWHYSGRVPTGKNLFYGWYDETNDLYAVADYGIGVNPYQAAYLSRITGKNVQHQHLLELRRLCRREPKREDMPLTQFLAQCHKLLRQTGYKYVVSFSDPAYGHTGGLYKAANFEHLGVTASERHVMDSEGNVRHRRLAFRHARRNGCSIQESRDALGLRVIVTPPKDRWFIDLGGGQRER